MKSRELISLELDREAILGRLDDMLEDAGCFTVEEHVLGQLRNDVVRAFATMEAELVKPKKALTPSQLMFGENGEAFPGEEVWSAWVD